MFLIRIDCGARTTVAELSRYIPADMPPPGCEASSAGVRLIAAALQAWEKKSRQMPAQLEQPHPELLRNADDLWIPDNTTVPAGRMRRVTVSPNAFKYPAGTAGLIAFTVDRIGTVRFIIDRNFVSVTPATSGQVGPRMSKVRSYDFFDFEWGPREIRTSAA